MRDSLCTLFPLCYDLVVDKDHWIRSRLMCSWNIQPRRNLNDCEIGEMDRLMEMLENHDLGDITQQDELVWNLDSENGFIVRSMYGALSPPTVCSYPGVCVWNSLIPLKVLFLWELWWDRALTVDNLIARGMVISNWCCLCKSVAESSGHLFIHCPWVVSFWSFLLARFEVVWV